MYMYVFCSHRKIFLWCKMPLCILFGRQNFRCVLEDKTFPQKMSNFIFIIIYFGDWSTRTNPNGWKISWNLGGSLIGYQDCTKLGRRVSFLWLIYQNNLLSLAYPIYNDKDITRSPSVPATHKETFFGSSQSKMAMKVHESTWTFMGFYGSP